MKKILIMLFLFMLIQTSCSAQTGITFLYINGSNNNDKKMKNWYENGVKKLHPYLKKEFEKQSLGQKYFLRNGEYYINEKPIIFFWGDRSHQDLTFVEKDLALSKKVSPKLAYYVRAAITHFLHDAIWVEKYRNMAPILDDLQDSVQAEAKKGNKVVLYGYSAGSFITYQYLLTRVPYINVVDFFNNVDISKEERDFIAQNPMENTCMNALGQELAVFSASGHIVPNDDNIELFKKDYMKLNEWTKEVCTPHNAVKGIVNFASPLVLFYSDLSDPKFEVTYYNRLLFKYIIENDMFWITVNFREDPLGFPGGRNLSIGEIEDIAKMDIEPHMGFLYDLSDTSSHRSVFLTHTSYWSERRNFSKAVVKAYVNGYRHEYDDGFQQDPMKKYGKKFRIMP